MARRRTVLSIPIPAGGAEVADVLAVLLGVAPSYDLTRLEPADGKATHLVLTAGRRRMRPGSLIDADPLPGMDAEDGAVEPPPEAVTNGQGEHAWAAAAE